MYFFDEYRRLHQSAMVSYIRMLNGVLKDNEELHIPLDDSTLEAAVIFTRIVSRAYDTSLNYTIAVPVVYNSYDTNIRVLPEEIDEILSDVVTKVFDYFVRYDIFSYYQKKKGHLSRNDMVALHVKNAGDTNFEKEFKIFLKLALNLYSDIQSTCTSICNNLTGENACCSYELPKYLYETVSSLAKLLSNYVVGFRVPSEISYTAEQAEQVSKALKGYTRGLSLTCIETGSNILSAYSEEPKEGTYKLDFDESFYTLAMDKESTKEILDLVSVPLSERGKVEKLLQKYLLHPQIAKW